MSERLTDEHLSELVAIADAFMPSRGLDLTLDAVEELRTLRSSTLTPEEAEAVKWARGFIQTMRGRDYRQPFNVHANRALSVLDKLIAAAGGE